MAELELDPHDVREGDGPESDDTELDLALDVREYELLSRLFSITVWLAKFPKRSQVVAHVRQEYECTDPVAELWVRKAEDMIALGVLDGVDDSRKLYHLRLNHLFGTLMQHLIKDQVEVTTKPLNLKIVTEDGVPTGKFQQVDGRITKVKHQALDPAVANMLFKLAKEMAHVTGGRPMTGRGGGGIGRVGTVNVQINHGELPSAQQADQLSNEQLARLMGAEIVQVLPGNIIDAERSERQSPDPQDQAPHEGTG